jgi:hypothetical protein
VLKSSLPILCAVLAAATAPAQVRPIPAPGALTDPRPRLPAGLGEAVDCVIGDFDRDGRPDLARASPDRLRILFQEPSGVFAERAAQAPIVVGIGNRIRGIASGDFDGDGDLDLVVGQLTAADFVLQNDGSGLFVRGPAGAIPPTPFLATLQIVAANFDGRGPDDLLVLPANGPPRLLLASLSGSFSDASGFLPAAALSARSVAVAGDLDLDGAPDLVLGGTALAPTLVLFNAGNGDFTQSAQSSPVSIAAADLAIADLDGLGPPEIVVAPETAVTAPPLVLRASRAGVVRVPPQAGGFTLNGWQQLALGDLDGNGFADLVALDDDGAVWAASGNGTGGFAAGNAILDAADRRGLCVADLDRDGDLDLWVPGSLERDAILLGWPGNGPTPTESATSLARGGYAGWRGALVDATGDSDPDLMLCSSTGRFALWVNDGGARFTESPLTPPDQNALGTIVAILPARLIAGGASRDLFVVGQPNPIVPSGLKVFGRPTVGAWVDRSQIVVGSQNGRVLTCASVATLGAATASVARSDLLLGDAQGLVSVHRNDGTTIAEVPSAVPFAHGSSIHAIVSGDLDGDGAADLVVLPSSGSPELHRASPPDRLHFTRVAGAFTTLVPASAAVIEDFDADGRRDVLLATPGSPEGLTFFRGLAGGGYVDVSPSEFATLPVLGDARALAVLGPPTARRVVVGRGSGPDLLIERPAGGPFRLVESIAIRGSESTRELLTADLDTDRDDDVVVLRSDASPALLLRSDLGLACRGPASAGKVMRLDVTAPPGRPVFVLFSPITMRAELPPFGVLRLVSPATFLGAVSPPTGAFAIELAVPSTLLPGALPMQIVTLDPATAAIELGNLEIVELSRG